MEGKRLKRKVKRQNRGGVDANWAEEVTLGKIEYRAAAFGCLLLAVVREKGKGKGKDSKIRGLKRIVGEDEKLKEVVVDLTEQISGMLDKNLFLSPSLDGAWSPVPRNR